MITLTCPGLLHALHLLAYFLQELVTSTNQKIEQMLFKKIYFVNTDYVFFL